MLTTATLYTAHAIPIEKSIQMPLILRRTLKDTESPLSFEEAYTTPGGIHVKKGGYYDPSTGSRGSYSSSSFHKEWHSP